MRGEALERYVKSAVRGLYGQRRAQVARELQGNLEHRVGEFMAFGDSREGAVERALLEFGAAEVVSRGLQEVHVMPIVMKSGALGLLGLGLGMALWSGSSAAVQSLAQIPAQVCTTSKDQARCELERQFPSSWLELGSLVQELRRQGVRVERTTLDEESLVLYFPFNVITNIPLRTKRFYLSEATYFQFAGKEYINTSLLLAALNANRIAFSFSDLPSHKILIGKVVLKLGDKTWNLGDLLTRALGSYVASRFTLKVTFQEAGLDCCAVRMKNTSSSETSSQFWSIKGQANASYFILRLADKTGGGKVVLVDTARADAAGVLKFPRYPLEARFVKTLVALSKSGLGESLMLVRLEWDKPDYFDLANVYVPSSVSTR